VGEAPLLHQPDHQRPSVRTSARGGGAGGRGRDRVKRTGECPLAGWRGESGDGVMGERERAVNGSCGGGRGFYRCAAARLGLGRCSGGEARIPVKIWVGQCAPSDRLLPLEEPRRGRPSRL
jgi:hypothetical protein